MKKIVSIVGAIAMAASMFAADFSATVQMEANIAEKAGDGINFLKPLHRDQKDNDALIVSANGEKAGGQFQFWYTFDGTDSTEGGAPVSASANNPLRIRKVSTWFKPVDMLKVTIGNIDLDSYKEHIFWWHGVYGAQPGTWAAFGGEYIAGVGLKAELAPVDGLNITTAIFPGIDTAMFSTNDGYGYKAYALKAQYNFGVGTAAVVFADKGKDQDKIIAIGADYGNEWAQGFYGFLNCNLRMNGGNLVGISFDNSEKFVADALTIQAHLPVVLYKAGDAMKAGMYATLKATYALGEFSPYFMATTEPDGDAGWLFDDFHFNMTFQPGVTFNVGSAGFEIAARIDVADGKLSNWKVPCIIKCGL